MSPEGMWESEVPRRWVTMEQLQPEVRRYVYSNANPWRVARLQGSHLDYLVRGVYIWATYDEKMIANAYCSHTWFADVEHPERITLEDVLMVTTSHGEYRLWELRRMLRQGDISPQRYRELRIWDQQALSGENEIEMLRERIGYNPLPWMDEAEDIARCQSAVDESSLQH